MHSDSKEYTEYRHSYGFASCPVVAKPKFSKHADNGLLTILAGKLQEGGVIQACTVIAKSTQSTDIAMVLLQAS